MKRINKLNTEPYEKRKGATYFLILIRVALLIAVIMALGCATTDTYRKKGDSPDKRDQQKGAHSDQSGTGAPGPTNEYGGTSPYGRTSPYYDPSGDYDSQYPESYDPLPPAQPVYPSDPGIAAPTYPSSGQRQYPGYDSSPNYPDAAGSHPYNQPQQESDDSEPRRRRLIWKGDSKSGKAWEDAPPEEVTEIESDEYKGAEDYLNEQNN